MDYEESREDDLKNDDAVSIKTREQEHQQPISSALLEQSSNSTKKSRQEIKCITKQLAIFSELEQFCGAVKSTVNQFYVMRYLLLQAKSLPVLDSENTLRYQIAIERRLSQLTGEFMVMHKMETH